MTAVAADARNPDAAAPLTTRQRRTLLILGLPTFGLALAVTTVSTYLPVLARTVTSSTTAIGMIIAAEGLLALFVPLGAGAWSDRLRTRWGGRLPFVIGAVPVAVVALAALGFTGSLGAMAVFVAVFFFAYFVAYEPYRALYPDLLGEEVAGRSQSTQAVARGAGTIAAVVGGGLLFAAAKPAPFVVAAALCAASVALFVVLMLHSGDRERAEHRRPEASSFRAVAGEVLRVVREQRSLRVFLIANGLWELSLAALKTFVVLYITRGLGHTTSFAALVIGAAAVFILLGAIVSGRLADRIGTRRVIAGALWAYGFGLLVPLVASSWPPAVAIAAPVVAFGGGVLMTLPFALLMELMPDEQHGTVTGYYGLSRGVGVMLGPIAAGAAISLAAPALSATEGYAAMWGVCSLAVLASIPLVSRMTSSVASDTRPGGRE